MTPKEWANSRKVVTLEKPGNRNASTCWELRPWCRDYSTIGRLPISYNGVLWDVRLHQKGAEDAFFFLELPFQDDWQVANPLARRIINGIVDRGAGAG